MQLHAHDTEPATVLHLLQLYSQLSFAIYKLITVLTTKPPQLSVSHVQDNLITECFFLHQLLMLPTSGKCHTSDTQLACSMHVWLCT